MLCARRVLSAVQQGPGAAGTCRRRLWAACLGSPAPLQPRRDSRQEIIESRPKPVSVMVSAWRMKHRNRGGGGGGGRENGKHDISHLFIPVPVKARQDEINVGEEMAGPLKKEDILRILNRFYTNDTVKELAKENGLDNYLYQQTFISFRKFCLESESLPVDLHIIISDVVQGAGHIHDIYPTFLKHAQKIFPHLICMDDLYKISDLSNPPNWYTEARALNRKVIFHAGPTNSGKTYHAMERFLSAESGIYCGPLKLLASEVFNKSNSRGTPCDLVTGEERRFGNTDGVAANHVACTVEMASVNTPYEVAVIDEIQMVRDPTRGWAWTRALLGLNAKEIHVCGEASAIGLVNELAIAAGEEVEVRRYKRLTDLTIEDYALQTLDNVHPGDCIVCFSKRDIHQVTREIERRGHEVAVIYGGLPPGTKLAQAHKFNDPNHPCNILVATDAIGMGLNLSIRRIIFYSLIRPNINEKGEIEMETISVSSALQIAGRAGRYGTQWDHGYVTTMKSEDHSTLCRLLSHVPDDIEQAGLHPTADQIELFAYHLPSYTLSNLVDVFVNLCTMDSSLYFMCLMDDFKFLADLIQHIPLPLRSRYVLCCSPINKKMPFVCAMFLKFTRQLSQNEAATLDWLCHQVKWPFSTPSTLLDLVHLEEVYDVFDLYLWLSYRFPDMFPEGDLVRDLQRELDGLIEDGVTQIVRLLRNSDSRTSNTAAETEDTFIMDQRKKSSSRGNRTLSMANAETILQDAAAAQKGKLPGQPRKKTMSRGTLTDRLLAQGLLSPKMLAELQREWQIQGSEDGENDDGSSSGRPRRNKPGKR
ncbi:ATP-dependent RNA helicase SUV3 homolog, mitochondrial-like [Eriocheir sinensis]|uniref:ATP-dependent RNA helicase SUV3 homolog, mitochondrial-like n=1 Tax=Eriocheir sinensis TaxID=95602 RepID=UPI0021C774E1|nr:ATP-dependent RNA helicase SUV3 homolog, mitochondrial-like [Eriocheir sinensis]